MSQLNGRLLFSPYFFFLTFGVFFEKRTLGLDILFDIYKREGSENMHGRKLKEGMYEGIHDRKLKEHFLRNHMIYFEINMAIVNLE